MDASVNREPIHDFSKSEPPKATTTRPKETNRNANSRQTPRTTTRIQTRNQHQDFQAPEPESDESPLKYCGYVTTDQQMSPERTEEDESHQPRTPAWDERVPMQRIRRQRRPSVEVYQRAEEFNRVAM